MLAKLSGWLNRIFLIDERRPLRRARRMIDAHEGVWTPKLGKDLSRYNDLRQSYDLRHDRKIGDLVLMILLSLAALGVFYSVWLPRVSETNVTVIARSYGLEFTRAHDADGMEDAAGSILREEIPIELWAGPPRIVGGRPTDLFGRAVAYTGMFGDAETATISAMTVAPGATVWLYVDRREGTVIIRAPRGGITLEIWTQTSGSGESGERFDTHDEGSIAHWSWPRAGADDGGGRFNSYILESVADRSGGSQFEVEFQTAQPIRFVPVQVDDLGYFTEYRASGEPHVTGGTISLPEIDETIELLESDSLELTVSSGRLSDLTVDGGTISGRFDGSVTEMSHASLAYGHNADIANDLMPRQLEYIYTDFGPAFSAGVILSIWGFLWTILKWFRRP